MKNQEIKNEHQLALFNKIQQTLPDKNSLVYVLSDLLEVGADATYRRIRGEKPISFAEAVKLCKHFQISMDALADVATDSNFIRCRYSPLDFNDIKDFMTFVQVSSDIFEKTRLTPDGEIIMSAVDVPIFHILPYRELTYFKLFSWSKSTYDFTTDYETFVKEGGTNETLEKNYDKIMKNYQLIPSTEIWTTNTTDTILRLLNYHSEMKHFSNKTTPLLLCEQLLNLLNTMQIWAEKGAKGPKDALFNLYISATDIANTFILFKQAGRSNCSVKLYTINGLGISDERFCQETENWLRKSARRSTLISGASEMERFKFFEGENRKIRHLMDKVQSGF